MLVFWQKTLTKQKYISTVAVAAAAAAAASGDSSNNNNIHGNVARSRTSPHISNWNIPLETGLPWKVSYGPSFSASSQDAVIAAKYIVSKMSRLRALAPSLSKGMRI